MAKDEKPENRRRIDDRSEFGMNERGRTLFCMYAWNATLNLYGTNEISGTLLMSMCGMNVAVESYTVYNIRVEPPVTGYLLIGLNQR